MKALLWLPFVSHALGMALQRNAFRDMRAPAPRAPATAPVNANPVPLRYYASCAQGLEEVLAQELQSPTIGAPRVRLGSRGVEFSGGVEVGYRAGQVTVLLALIWYSNTCSR